MQTTLTRGNLNFLLLLSSLNKVNFLKETDDLQSKITQMCVSLAKDFILAETANKHVKDIVYFEKNIDTKDLEKIRITKDTKLQEDLRLSLVGCLALVTMLENEFHIKLQDREYLKPELSIGELATYFMALS